MGTCNVLDIGLDSSDWESNDKIGALTVLTFHWCWTDKKKEREVNKQTVNLERDKYNEENKQGNVIEKTKLL